MKNEDIEEIVAVLRRESNATLSRIRPGDAVVVRDAMVNQAFEFDRLADALLADAGERVELSAQAWRACALAMLDAGDAIRSLLDAGVLRDEDGCRWPRVAAERVLDVLEFVQARVPGLRVESLAGEVEP